MKTLVCSELTEDPLPYEKELPFNYCDFSSFTFKCKGILHNTSMTRTNDLVEITIGPIQTRKGMWHFFISCVPSAFMLRDRIISYESMPFQSDLKTPILYPPLYMHHVHFMGHFWALHGDHYYEKTGLEGYKHTVPHEKCTYPPSFAEQIPGHSTGIIYNDIRANSHISSFYLRQSIHIKNEKECELIRPIEIGQPIDLLSKFQTNDRYSRFYPPVTDSMSLIELQMNRNDKYTFENAWYHSHPVGFYGFIMIQQKLKCAQGPNYGSFIPIKDTATVFTHFLKHPAVICHGMPAPFESINGNLYERGKPPTCKQSISTKGNHSHEFSLLLFFKDKFLRGESIPMHFVFWIYSLNSDFMMPQKKFISHMRLCTGVPF